MAPKAMEDQFILSSAEVTRPNGETERQTYVTYNGHVIGNPLVCPPREQRTLVAWLNTNKADLESALGVPTKGYWEER